MKPTYFPVRQRGYAVVFFLFFIGAVALGIYSLYDSGWVASERIRLQNTADNTTYSAVTMLSRDMNMMAITNRGMIANQVMIGQLVGLSSWSNYLQKTAENINLVAKITYIIPPVGAIVNRITEALEQIATRVSDVLDEVASGLITVQDAVNGAISALQRGYHNATYGMIPAMYLEVMRENDPDVSVETLSSMYNISQFLEVMGGEFKQYKEHSGRGGGSSAQQLENARIAQFAKLINDSRDGFSADRSDALGRVTLFPARASVDVRAGTDFVMNRSGDWEWTSMDVMSLNIGAYSCGFRCRWRDAETPIGWGAGHALKENDSYNYSTNRNGNLRTHQASSSWRNVNYAGSAKNSRYWRDAFGGGSRSTRSAAYLAAAADGDNNLANITGIRPFYDFVSNDPRNTTGTLTLIYSKPAESMRLRRKMAEDFNAGHVGDAVNIDEQGSVPGNRIYALASARVSFERPRDIPLASTATPWAVNWGRHDNLHEYGNLYNPFWEPKLARTDANLTRLLLGALGD